MSEGEKIMLYTKMKYWNNNVNIVQSIGMK